jgi:hypothetical protein
MRIIAIGDIHGRSSWEKILEKEKYDHCIFMGDYLDSREGIAADQQLKNFEAILNFKRKNLSSITLLLGNHDYHYLLTNSERYSGFQPEIQAEAAHMLQPAIDAGHIQPCLITENLLFSHAGITNTWCKKNNVHMIDLQNEINQLLQTSPDAFQFTYGKNFSPFGDDIDQSPIWVRPNSLKEDMIHGYTQIVGHTTQNKIRTDDNLLLIDTLGTSHEYLIWENGNFHTGCCY